MKKKAALLLILLLVLSTGCQKTISLFEGRLVDLTHDFSADTVYWPTSETFELVTVFRGQTKGGFYYEANKFSASEHGGTHIDAPSHFVRGMTRVDEIPLERLMGEAVIVDVSVKALTNPDYQVSSGDFLAWELEHGTIPEGAIVLLRTGYGRHWPDRQKYMGTTERGAGAVAKLHFPGLSPEGARWLVENRRISAVGVDTLSIDYGQSKLFESHRILFKENIPVFENVANLEELPAKGALVIALPMKIKGGSGGPLRIVAIVPE